MSTTQKILRCLMLTTSQNDHEALAAIRKANQLLACCNLNWEQYLGVAKRMDVEEQEAEPADPESENPDNYAPKKRMTRFERTALMIAEVKAYLERTGSPSISFIESLEEGLLKYGSLTEKQMNALKKFHKNAKRVPF